MKELLHSARALLTDLASTLLFFGLYALSGNLTLSVATGMALAIGQIGWQIAHGRGVDAMQWVSLVVVLASGAATLVARNPIFMMLQPSLIYLLVGSAMLKRGWMLRYLPAIALQTVPDLAIGFGYVWAGMMFFSAGLNLVLAHFCSLVTWGVLISAWGTTSKTALFFIQFGVMKTIGRKRYRARQGAGQNELAIAQSG